MTEPGLVLFLLHSRDHKRSYPQCPLLAHTASCVNPAFPYALAGSNRIQEGAIKTDHKQQLRTTRSGPCSRAQPSQMKAEGSNVGSTGRGQVLLSLGSPPPPREDIRPLPSRKHSSKAIKQPICVPGELGQVLPDHRAECPFGSSNCNCFQNWEQVLGHHHDSRNAEHKDEPTEDVCQWRARKRRGRMAFFKSRKLNYHSKSTFMHIRNLVKKGKKRALYSKIIWPSFGNYYWKCTFLPLLLPPV